MKKLTFLLLLFSTTAMGQAALRIGDRVLDKVFTNVKTYKNGSLQLSDLNKKLIILDFWNRMCSTCIDAMPKVQKLQDKFDTDIQIIYVLRPKDSDTYPYLYNRVENIRNLKIPNIINDDILYDSLFRHAGIGDPFQVWLDENLEVVASSDYVRLTEENIQKFLSGESKQIAKGKEIYRGAYRNRSASIMKLMQEESQYQPLQYSLLTRGDNFVGYTGNEVLLDTIKNELTGLRFINLSMQELYKRYNNITEGAQRIYFENENIDNKTLYCYEQFSPERGYAFRSTVLKQDLDTYFNIKSSYETRNEECLIIHIVDSLKLKSVRNKEKRLMDKRGKDLNLEAISIQRNGDGIILKRARLEQLSNAIKDKLGDKMIVINEFGIFGVGSRAKLYPPINGKENPELFFFIDLDIKSALDDIPSLQMELSKYGIGLKKEIRAVKCLVLR